MKRVLFISSTGGHFTELLALRTLFDRYDYHVAVEQDEVSSGYAGEFGGRITFMPRGTRDDGITYLGTFAVTVGRTFRLLKSFRPDVLVTTGSHTAIPACYMARLFGCRVVYIETSANRHSRSLAGRLAYPVADLFVVQWQSMLLLYPKAQYAGCVFG